MDEASVKKLMKTIAELTNDLEHERRIGALRDRMEKATDRLLESEELYRHDSWKEICKLRGLLRTEVKRTAILKRTLLEKRRAIARLEAALAARA